MTWKYNTIACCVNNCLFKFRNWLVTQDHSHNIRISFLHGQRQKVLNYGCLFTLKHPVNAHGLYNRRNRTDKDD